MASMTSKERILAAIRCEEVDHVPMILIFWESPRHPMAEWETERERLERFRRWGWDTRVRMLAQVSPSEDVRIETGYERDGETIVLRQVWRTPAGTLEERLKVSDDWDEARSGLRRCPDDAARSVTDHVPFFDDFRSSRYIEFPVKGADDLAALEYVFPLDNPRDDELMARRHAEARGLADEFEVPLELYQPAGMDWLIWLYPAGEAVMRVVDDGPTMKRILDRINSAYQRRLEFCLELGVDIVLRRGWYESTDFWSPKIFADCAVPAIETEIEAASRAAGAAYVYQMCTGVMPLLPELASLPFDCLFGVEPAYGGRQDLKEIRARLPGKSMWGGISGPEHLGRGTPADTERAVERAFEACGKTGFILGPGVGIRHDWPRENIEACSRAWKRLR